MINYLTKNDLSLCTYKSYQKNDVIRNEGDICETVDIVISGVVNISSFSFDGNEIIFNVVKNKEMFGNHLIFSTDNRYKGNVVCKTNVTILEIRKNALINILASNKKALEEYLKIQCNFEQQLNSKLKILSFNKADERIRYLFYINNNVIEFVSMKNLSIQLGLSREATSRLINKMIKDKQIYKENRKLFYKY